MKKVVLIDYVNNGTTSKRFFNSDEVKVTLKDGFFVFEHINGNTFYLNSSIIKELRILEVEENK